MKKIIAILLLSVGIVSCDYLDLVPDNVPTIDNAFTMRSEAEKYLFTCYSYLPKDADINSNPALSGGDEIWELTDESLATQFARLAKGNQNIINPIGAQWGRCYQAIRDCNIFLENIGKVPDLENEEKRQWIAEVKFLKAYYHFILLRNYGPIPIVKENKPISSTVNDVKVYRDPVDDCFAYIAELIDEAKDDLPSIINDPKYLGKITKPVAYAMKAKILTYAASPLFNGNTDQATLKNNNSNEPLFNQTYSEEKWEKAAEACKEAIVACETANIKLYEHPAFYQGFNLTDTIRTQMSLRLAITQRWNDEIIWGNTQSWMGDMQTYGAPDWAPSSQARVWMDNKYDAPMKIAEEFYTEHGVPINEDKTWEYNDRYKTRAATGDEKLYVKNGYTTANLNFKREPRFYAWLGFDGGIWYGQGRYDDKQPDDLYCLKTKLGQAQGYYSRFGGPITGYSLKKLIHLENLRSPTGYTVIKYPWPLLRLADLYLLYAECLNEANGPSEEALKYIDYVRKRAGVLSVEDAWPAYSKFPDKYKTKAGFREIVQTERLIELSFEANRFWDLRRWKRAIREMNQPIKGWNVGGSTVATFYHPVLIFSQTFRLRDYFWPIAEGELTKNPNLIQNIGWR